MEAVAVAGILSAGASLFTGVRQLSAANKSGHIASQNAKRIRMETEEQARRLEKSNERELARARARAAASGLEMDEGSISLFLSEMEDEQEAQLDWLKKSGRSRAEITEDEGSYYKTIGRTEAIGSFGAMFGQAPDIYTSGRQAGWWS